MCNISPHKFFVMKNIPVEEAISGNLETCFGVSRRSHEIERRIDNTRSVIYCHCMARMVSYPCITRKVRIRLKWPVDIYVHDLQFMTAVWRKKITVTPFRLQ